MSKQLIEQIIEDLEQLPMEGGNSETDREIQDFLDYLDQLKEGKA